MSGSQLQQSGTQPNGGSANVDPSMEDILASIRRILSEEDPPEAPPEPELKQDAREVEQPEDVLVLDSSMLVADPPRPSPVARSAPPPPPPILMPSAIEEPRVEEPPGRAMPVEAKPAGAMPAGATRSEAEPVSGVPEADPSIADHHPVDRAPDEPAMVETALSGAAAIEPIMLSSAPAETAAVEEPAPVNPPVDHANPPGSASAIAAGEEAVAPVPVHEFVAARTEAPLSADAIPALAPALIAGSEPPPRPPSFGLPESPVLVPVPRPASHAPLIRRPVSMTRDPAFMVPPPPPLPTDPPASPTFSLPEPTPTATTPQSETPLMSASLSAAIASPETANAAAGSISNLVRALTSDRSTQVWGGGPTIADLVREEMRPMLKTWLDNNLPPLVERLVRAEIERVISRASV